MTNFEHSQPVDTTPRLADPVLFHYGKISLSEPGIMRRDPSDIIRSGDLHYIWYTKVVEGAPRYPGGWAGTVWYATSTDGRSWEEQGEAVGRGASGSWDSHGVYSPNILVHAGKYYLAYTAQSEEEPNFAHRQAAIGLAVSTSPDGPWEKLPGPAVAPSESFDAADGFLCDDAVFVVLEAKIWLYYKGFPAALDQDGRRIRYQMESRPQNTFLLAAVADRPEGPYAKHPAGALHRGHEVVVWPDGGGGVGSWDIQGPDLRYYAAPDGIRFVTQCPLASRPMAAGIYRADFEAGWNGSRPSWGICMEPKNQGGLQRFEIEWPAALND